MWYLQIAKIRRELIVRIASIVGSFASVWGLVLACWPKQEDFTWWMIVLAVISVLFFLTAIVSELMALRTIQVIPGRDQGKIKDYMFQWISRGGRTAVFSRDLSWVADDVKMKELLLTKARRRELLICLPEEIELARELEQEGAEIYIYSHVNHLPESRFTIVNFGHMDARVAVGRGIGENHVIEEFSTGAHPAFHMAIDLFEFVMKSCRR